MTKKISTKLKKKDELNYREADGERTCADCEHFFPNALRCTVQGTRASKAFEIQEENVCDAWNDITFENTWYLACIAHQNKVFFEVREMTANPDDLEEENAEVSEVCKFEIEMPVASIPKSVFNRLKEYFEKKGCPDFLVNLNPQTMPGERLGDLLRSWGIKYTEMDMSNHDFGVSIPEDMEPTEMLSAMAHAYLSQQEG